MDDLTRFREAACEAAEVGAGVLARWRSRFQVREKGRADLVTEADVESQNAVRSFLLGRFPGHAFLGEEGDAARNRPGPGHPPTWIVDPLDGTTNYVHDIPLYAVSIGLQIDGELVVGVVYEPTRDEMFHAARGQGAFLNWRRLRTTPTDRLDGAMLATGFPPDLQRPGPLAGVVALVLAAHAVAAAHRLDGHQPGLPRGRPVRRLLRLRQPRLGRGRRRRSWSARPAAGSPRIDGGEPTTRSPPRRWPATARCTPLCSRRWRGAAASGGCETPGISTGRCVEVCSSPDNCGILE